MITGLQVVLVCAFEWAFNVVGTGTQVFSYASNVLMGWLVGIIMGDAKMGLEVGAEMTLMSLGVGGFGGSSVPNYKLGTIIGTIFAITTGDGITAAITIGVPVAALGTELDVLQKMIGSFFLHGEMAAVEKGNFKAMGTWVWAGLIICQGLVGVIPIFLVMTVGADFITNLIANMPAWLNNGMSVVGGLLPAVGFATLLKYMPLKNYGVYAILGFVLYSYLGLGMLPIALIVVVFAFNEYRSLEANTEMKKLAAAGGAAGATGDDYDE